MSEFRLGVDGGGTHTDLALLDASGGMLIEKVQSTPSNLAVAVLDGIARIVERGIDPREIDFFSRATTVTTNALLEMYRARVGKLITDRFQAIQEVQSQARESN